MSKYMESSLCISCPVVCLHLFVTTIYLIIDIIDYVNVYVVYNIYDLIFLSLFARVYVLVIISVVALCINAQMKLD